MSSITSVCVVLALITHASAQNCDHLGIRLYENLGCKVVNTDPETSCPTSYDCGILKSNGKCVVHGTIYEPGDKIQPNEAEFSCEFGCFCTTRNNESKISCAQGQCGLLPEPRPGCHLKYNLEGCCSIGEICPKNATHQCLVDGSSYRDGERFSPKNSCHVCLCQQKGPYCKQTSCNAQIRYQTEIQKGCAPLYVNQKDDGEKKCCPDTWTCPDGNETIIEDIANSTSTCFFGNKSIPLGHSFAKKIQYLYRPLEIKCECKIPPLLHCRNEIL